MSSKKTFVKSAARNKKDPELLKELQNITVNESPSEIYWIDRDSNIFYANAGAAEVLGYPPEEIVKMKVVDVDPHYDQKTWEIHWKDIIAKGKTIIQSEHKKRDGTLYPVEIRLNIVNFQGVDYICAIATDISERKRQEKHKNERSKQIIRYQQALLKIAYLSSPDLKTNVRFILEEAASVLKISRVSMWLFSEDRTSIICQDMLCSSGEKKHLSGDVIHEKDFPTYFEAIKKERMIAAADARTNPLTYEFTESYLIPNEIFSMLDVPIWLGGKVIGIICYESVGEKRKWAPVDCDFATSIADMAALAVEGDRRRKAEESLRIEKRWSDTIINLAPDIVVGLGTGSKIVLFNKFAEELTGYSSAEVIGKIWFDIFIPQEEKTSVNIVWDKLLESMGKNHKHENCIVTKDGRKLRVAWSNAVITSPAGEQMVLSIGQDVTLRRKMEEALEQSEIKHRSIFENANDPILIVDTETGIILLANKAAAKFFGHSVESLIGMHQTELHPRGEEEEYSKKFKEAAELRNVVVRGVFIVKNDGTKIPVQISCSAVTWQGKKVVQGIFTDVSTYKKMEDMLSKELADAQRLADIGTLSATVAHELRNPLGVIRTALYNIKRKNKDSNLEKHLTNIEKKIYDSDRIIQNLLSYARIKMPQRSEVGIKTIIEESISNCSDKYKTKNIALKTSFELPDNFTINADPTQISELLMNLLDNACMAVAPDLGNITITAKYLEAEELLEIKISDNGEGMTAEQLEKAFNPFFSSRVTGVGLGLPVCKHIVTLHGGIIDMASEKGKGTYVTITMPTGSGQKIPNKQS